MADLEVTSGSETPLEQATKAVAAEVAAGRPGFGTAPTPGGTFAILLGHVSQRVLAIPNGAMIAINLDRRQLSMLRSRIDHMLRNRD